MHLIATSALGIYTYQHVAESYRYSLSNIDQQTMDDLLAGPNGEDYVEAGVNLIDNGEVTIDGVVHTFFENDGDIWAVSEADLADPTNELLCTSYEDVIEKANASGHKEWATCKACDCEMPVTDNRCMWCTQPVN